MICADLARAWLDAKAIEDTHVVFVVFNCFDLWSFVAKIWVPEPRVKACCLRWLRIGAQLLLRSRSRYTKRRNHRHWPRTVFDQVMRARLRHNFNWGQALHHLSLLRRCVARYSVGLRWDLWGDVERLKLFWWVKCYPIFLNRFQLVLQLLKILAL